MKRTFMARLALTATAGLAGVALAQDPAPADEPGLTGKTHPMDVIAAREALMYESEELMRPIDTYTVDGGDDLEALIVAADTINAMLLAVPHLFPPATNLYDASAEAPVTLALPAIWESFPTFYSLASAASTAAAAMAEMTDPDPDELRMAALGLRASCDACHALYLRPYTPSEVTEEDREFDFDSVFPKN
jgi:cytochrome c556